MIRVIPILLFLFVSVFATAQTFMIDETDVSGGASLLTSFPDPTDIVAHSTVTNQTSNQLDMKWEITVISSPDPLWAFAVCDRNLCYGTTTTTEEFILTDGEEGRLDAHAYPAGGPGVIDGAVPGEAVVEVTVTNLDDLNETMTAVYTFTLDGLVSVTEFTKSQLVVYPNPTSDFFLLKGSEHVSNVVITDILGRQVRTFNVNNATQQYSLGDFPQGIYLVKLLDEADRTLKVLKLKKS